MIFPKVYKNLPKINLTMLVWVVKLLFFFGISGPTPWGNGIHVGFEHIVQMGLVQPPTSCVSTANLLYSV